ncbi:Uu.00g100740.m01.CDS01 [Anthostomella pinea]|uniref:Uu.00g100740.m01.CDS01 n=1 Tax=Anthostomella pinea TaxID=933095 RepID=A0AAI8YCY2_9PEZI|nr:Uu.00g100740.m01.CDS01 [Anthostomella pinea]
MLSSTYFEEFIQRIKSKIEEELKASSVSVPVAVLPSKAPDPLTAGNIDSIIPLLLTGLQNKYRLHVLSIHWKQDLRKISKATFDRCEANVKDAIDSFLPPKWEGKDEEGPALRKDDEKAVEKWNEAWARENAGEAQK